MRVFSVPLSVPFLRSVIAALVDGRLVRGFEARKNPERLAQATLYLPTRRAGRMAREIFLDELNSDAAVLPRIVALGDIDEDELAFAQAATPGMAALEIPPAMDGLQRRLLLAQLIALWAKRIKPIDPTQAPLVTAGPDSTLALADDLARLMDDMVTREVDWAALDTLTPEAFDVYWKLTLEFLGIARQYWPEILKTHGRIEPAARRDLLIEAEAARLTLHHDGPVIAAGSTGSMPVTAKFLQAVASLPNGAVVLPGLDTDLDDAAWQSIGGTRSADGQTTTQPSSNHPQFAMHALLQRFGHQARRCRNSWAGGAARPRRAGLGGDAALERHGAMAPAAGGARCRRAHQLRHARPRGDRRRQSRDGGACDRGCDARGTASEQIGRFGDAGPRAGAAGDGGARPLEPAVRRFRRRFADGYFGGNFRAAGGGDGGQATGAADLAGALKASVVPARPRRGRAQARDQKHWSWCCCAARGRRPEASG